MAPKKTQRTALWYYAMDCMNNGSCTSNNIREAIEAVYPSWKSMSTTERMPFETKYDEWKRSIKADVPTYTPTGVVKLEEVEMDESTIIGRRVEAMLKKFDQDTLKSNFFYFIKFQSLCKCDKFNDDKYNYSPYFVLVEVAITEYSLLNGIQRSYHAFIKPNKVPLGYRSQCMDSSREILGENVSFDSFNQVKKSYVEIFKEINDFIQSGHDENNNNPITVFCMGKDVAETKFGLKFLYDRAFEYLDMSKMEPNIPKPIEKVYDLETLVNKLGKLKINDFCSANDILSSYAFDYCLNTRCNWHDENGLIKCSLGFVKKYCFLISDNICQLFNIKLTKNHIPVQESVGTVLKTTDFGFRNRAVGYRGRNDNNSFSRQEDKKFYDLKSSNNNINRNFDDDDVQYQDSVGSEIASNFNYPVKRSANGAAFASTDIRYNEVDRQSTITESSLRSKIPSIYENRRLEMSIPKGLNEEENEDGWITKPVYKSSRTLDQDSKSVVSDNSIGNEISSSVSGATKMSSSFKYQGRGKFTRKN